MYTYRKIAGWNIAFGAALGAFSLWMALAPFFGKAEPHSPVGIALIAFLAVVAVSIVQLAVAFRKAPSPKTAIPVAVNTAVLLWAVLIQIVAISPFKEQVGVWNWILAAAVVYYVHKRWLRPAALVQREEEQGA